MPAVARANGVDTVSSLTGTLSSSSPPPPVYNNPINTVTGTGSPDVFVNGTPVVRQNDTVGVHLNSTGGTDTSVLTTFSATVFVNGKGIGRVGDQYTSDNTITSGSPTVFAG
jgi:uncharacterized Zn-binding protein involved in type VI secretion